MHMPTERNIVPMTDESRSVSKYPMTKSVTAQLIIYCPTRKESTLVGQHSAGDICPVCKGLRKKEGIPKETPMCEFIMVPN